MMQITSVMPLFPQTVVVGSIDIDHNKIISDLGLKFSNEQYYSSQDKFYKTDPYLYKENTYKELSDSILEITSKICDEVFCYEDTYPEISLMWAIGTPKTKNIHRHFHPNSIFSGVYYPQNIDYSEIRFYSPHKPTLLPKIAVKNIYSSITMSYTPSQGDIIIFPSHLEHDTDINSTDDLRFSVAFNIFLRGNFGHDETLSSISL
jgi:uncharacterized protein (TIGR02466 family)